MDLAMSLFFIFLVIVATTYIVEMLSLHRFNLMVLKYGFVFKRKQIPIKHINWTVGDGVHKEGVGKFVFIPSLKFGYFVTKFTLMRRYGIIGYSIGNVITVYGDFMEDSQVLFVKYKVSYRILAIILLWYIVLLLYTFSGEVKYIAVGFVFFIVSTLLLFIWFYILDIKALNIQDGLIKLLKIKQLPVSCNESKKQT